MNILHASTNPPLLERLKQMLASSARADIAVGYFFMSGFEAVAEDLARQQKVRILVGRTDRQVLEQVAAGLQQAEALQARLQQDGTVRRRDKEQAAAQAARQIGEGVARLPQNKASEKAVALLKDMVAGGKLEVRAYARGLLHAKAYLCWYDNHAEPGAAVVGSSNLTLAGFTGNTELNVRVTGDAEMDELKRWFEDLWKDSTDISQQLLVELGRSWPLAQTPPYHVYLKALYELYGDEVAGGVAMEPPPRDPQLANFQMDAVRRALWMIDLHDGCFIGDVVGLGKSFIGAEILRQLGHAEKGKPLIICPARLVPMWEKMNELFRLGAEVVSMSAIAPPGGGTYDEEQEEYVDEPYEGPGIVLQEKYANRGPVLVDEAHHFRNLNRRYAALSSYLASGDHRVVLMSATPQNLGPRDVYRQLRLFLDETDHGLKIEPLAMGDYFNAIQAWYQYRAERDNWERDYHQWQAAKGRKKGPAPEPPAAPKVPRADIEQVLAPVFIRRRRKDIKELYGDSAEVGGKPVKFPAPRLETLTYRLDKVYGKAGPYHELEKRLKQHRGARYRVTDYFQDPVAARTKPEYRDLFRARDRVAGLMGVLLVKRLESSVEAFRSTLASLMRSNRNFRDCLDSDFVPIGKTATRLMGGGSLDPDDVLQALQKEEAQRTTAGQPRSRLVHPVNGFDVDRWKKDLDADHALLSGIAASVAGIGPKDDDKLQSLRKFLARPEIKQAKLLIFSEAETTVEYLFQQLNPGGKDPTIARLSGGNKDQFADIVKRFAPVANLKEKEKLPGSEIRLLIATDVVSEGQNLQDCGRVLNYDLNPVRLVQRFGRVDRIGTEYSTIYLYNMWPDTDIDAALDLTDRLLRRIQSFHDFIGLDSRLLAQTERLNAKAMYRIYKDQRLPDTDDDLDEVASHQRGVGLLQRILEKDPGLWDIITHLPDGIRAAVKAAAPAEPEAEAQRFIQNVLAIVGAQMPLGTPAQQAGVESPFDEPRVGETVVLLSAGGVRESYAVGRVLAPRSISNARLLGSLECSPNTPAAPLPVDTNERVMAAYGAFRLDLSRKLGKARRPGSDTRVHRYLSKTLGLAREEFRDNPAELQRIGVLRQIFLGHLPAAVLPELRDIRELQLAGMSLIRRLEALRERHRLNPPDEEEDAAAPDTEVVRIVCSEGMTR